ncbi:hypothetical protein J2W37_000693 [Variovorax paradoxus]|uniref:hypothetical protein n=1 Tax=Variovorax paradoxus TaxID=34073 RepID=UPI0027898B8F|nr:hypothetical protein [Variovorax paradoxus]MDP9962987.1 hypothetical protein [Variovorax paradoxus]
MASKKKQPTPALLEEMLRHSKSLQPLPAEAIAELTRLQTLDVSSYAEMDVRAEIIDPVLKILGYQKQTQFSVDREKNLKILDKDVFIDYSVMLFEENFWIIEAKRVKRKKLKFIDTEVVQALQYAAHPDINAALLVLCDGRLFEVYDREESLVTPVARVEVKRLVEDFDLLRAFLAPWQAWFFQKRRLLRLMDKVLDREMNLQRLEEFRYDVNRRLIEKRTVVLQNFQTLSNWEADSQRATSHLRAAETRELVDLQFFLGHSIGNMNTISSTLVERAKLGAFEILHAVFPDRPRDTNDHYWANALHFLLSFEASGTTASWLPSFLGPMREETKASDAVKRLITFCLTTFDGDAPRKLILQYSASVRRVAKLMMINIPGGLAGGKAMHLFVRRTVDELDVAQFLSSPEGHNLRQLGAIQYRQTARFCQDCEDDRENFREALARQKLKELWEAERLLLGNGAAYRAANAAASLGEIGPTEPAWVIYDSLGHDSLCAIGLFPKWVEYAMTEHRESIERLARHGSWKARELLGLQMTDPQEQLSLAECAARFFDGDVALCRSLVEGYGFARSLGDFPHPSLT